MALTVIGFDGISSGEVLRWQVSCERGEGYIDGENVRMTEEEALAQYDEALISSMPPGAMPGAAATRRGWTTTPRRSGRSRTM